MSDDLNDGVNNLILKKDIYNLRIKTTLIAVQDMSFERFLKIHLEIGPEISPCDLFRNAITDSLSAVEYAIKEDDKELLKYVDLLIEKLDSEQGDEENIPLGKLFAKLLEKAKSVCHAGLPVKGMVVTFEYGHLYRAFNEKIVPSRSRKQNNNVPYSNN